jgi:putative ABC transport system permease protein
MGVRLALGATPQRIERMVLFDGLRPVVDGLVLGIAAGIAGRLALRPLFTEPIPVIDPVAFSLLPIPLLVAAALACYLPARRAGRVPPNQALREL